MKARAVNQNTEPYDVYVGRPSKWGNPYSHRDDTLAEFKVRTRKESVEKENISFLWIIDKKYEDFEKILAKYANSLDSVLF